MQKTQESNEWSASHCCWLLVYVLGERVTNRTNVSSSSSWRGLWTQPCSYYYRASIKTLLFSFCFTLCVVVLLTVLFCVSARRRWILMPSMLMALQQLRSTKLLLWMLIRCLICIRLSVKFPHKSLQLPPYDEVCPHLPNPERQHRNNVVTPYAWHQIHIKDCLDCRVTAGSHCVKWR